MLILERGRPDGRGCGSGSLSSTRGVVTGTDSTATHHTQDPVSPGCSPNPGMPGPTMQGASGSTNSQTDKKQTSVLAS